ncbi:electron transport complex subunit E [Desulfococcaceae bacterium HSG9]|nr:electron transport complex subunit E [Desulfococcaceae bacterium HSG9]
MAKSIVQEFTKGLWEEIPPFRLVLGLCPVLAVTKSVENGIGMGLATTFVLIGSNLLVSAMRKVIPNKIRIACFIIVIATFVTVVELLMQAYTYALFLQLGIFIPLIVVNCIVLGRAEAFAFKNGIIPSLADGAGIGIGFTLALAALGAVRELLGNNSITIWSPWDLSFPMILGSSFQPFTFMVEAPGAFMCLGLMLCFMNLFEK